MLALPTLHSLLTTLSSKVPWQTLPPCPFGKGLYSDGSPFPVVGCGGFCGGDVSTEAMEWACGKGVASRAKPRSLWGHDICFLWPSSPFALGQLVCPEPLSVPGLVLPAWASGPGKLCFNFFTHDFIPISTSQHFLAACWTYLSSRSWTHVRNTDCFSKWGHLGHAPSEIDHI